MSLPAVALPPVALDPTVWRKFVDGAETLAVSLVTAAVILIVTVWLSRWASHGVRRLLGRLPRTRSDATLQGFFSSLARWAVLIVGLIAVLTEIGVETTSIIAVLGAASLALGLALQGTLSNVAAGVMLLIFRPYRVGDFVEIAGKQGTVQHLDLFTTELATPDNVKLTAPNAKIFGDFIFNFSANPIRRVDLLLHVDYAVSLAEALPRLRALADDSRALAEPEPLVEITALKDSWAEVALRVWTTNADYGPFKSDLQAAARRLWSEAGWPTAYPHQVAVTREPASPG